MRLRVPQAPSRTLRKCGPAAARSGLRAGAGPRGRDPAALHVEVGAPWSPADAPAMHVVSVTVRNDGGRSAAEVDVEVVLPGDPPEHRELTFDHVPHGSSRSGALTFAHRPEPGQLRPRVLGYLEP